jgi:2-polyprenyl-6-methoxyphenol hydroxylase-like FAD-dependent oxidoreductase
MRIAISGAGVAGPALAHWLLRTGHEPTLIEQAPHVRAGGYVIDFWGLGYTLVERMGILRQVLEAGYAVEEVRLVDAHGRRAGGFRTEAMRGMLDGRFTSLPRGDLAAQIYRTIEGRVEALFGNSITAIDEQADRVCVDLAQGGQRAFDLVIGADGLHSAVREIAFGPESRFERNLGYYVAAFEADGYRPRDELVYVSYGTPGRQISRFSLRGDRTMFLFVFLADHLAGPEPHGLDERKRTLHALFDAVGWEAAEILEAMEQVDELYFDRVSQIVMDRWSKGRIALIGDAGACVSLLAGEGTGLALTEAYVLAGELHRAGGDYETGFRRYEERLRPFIEGKQRSARNFASSFAPRTAFGLWFRNQATQFMAIPGVANRIIGTGLRDDIALPDYGM